MDYYELLGVGENASQPEIKRAYFGKIKQYTPENAPEMFKQIREAYDCLRDEEKRKQYTKILKSPSIPALTQAREAMKLKNFKKAIELLKKANEAFPGSEVIKEALATAYEENDSTGNAIKVYEELVMQCPSNQDFALALARNYEKRGYTKKAWEQFNKAVKINPNNPDAWGEWFHTCHHADVSSLAKIIYEAETISEDIFEKNYVIYIQFWMKLNPRNHLDDEFQLKHYDVFRKFLIYCKKDRFPEKESILILLDFLMYILRASNADMELINDGLQIVEQNLNSENKEHYEHLKIAYAMHQLRSDTKINNALHDLTVTALQRNEPDNFFDKMDEYEYKMIQAYILVHLTTLKDSILYFKENYLSLYSLNQSFFEQLEDLEKRRRLENSLKKQMKIIRENPDLFLGTQPSLDPLDSFDETPVRRSAPKVGRNDPCPCGSGKKYKHCCGR